MRKSTIKRISKIILTILLLPFRFIFWLLIQPFIEILLRVFSYWRILLFCGGFSYITYQIALSINKTDPVQSGFIMNIAASFVYTCFAILYIDRFLENKESSRWNTVKELISREILSNIETLISELQFALHLMPPAPS